MQPRDLKVKVARSIADNQLDQDKRQRQKAEKYRERGRVDGVRRALGPQERIQVHVYCLLFTVYGLPKPPRSVRSLALNSTRHEATSKPGLRARGLSARASFLSASSYPS